VPDDYPDARDFIRSMHKLAAPFIAERTAVLYGATSKGRPYILGSGVPLLIADHHFILTAAHVLDSVIRDRAAVYLSGSRRGGRLLPVDPLHCTRSALPTTANREDDPFDTCVIELPSEMVAHVADAIAFCTLDDSDPFDEAQMGSYYFLHGYPSVRMRLDVRKSTVRCESLPYGTILYDGSRGAWPQFEDVHLDLDFNPRTNVDDAGRRAILPRPQGISGAGIWRLSSAGVERSSWSLANVKLVAIEHRYHESLNVLRGTRIKYFNRILSETFVGCREAMDHQWPP
jgi:hypothetical protein